MVALGLEFEDFLLGEKFELADNLHLVDFVESVYTGADGLEIGEGAAEPSLVDIEHIAAFGFLLDCVLSLLLGADEQNGLPFRGNFLHEFVSLFDEVDGNLKVDDVNVVTGCVDVLRHLGVPAFALMTEVHACFEQGFHCGDCHFRPP